jgi:hypothetical protein
MISLSAIADLLAPSYGRAKSLGVSALIIRSAIAEGGTGRSFSLSPLTGGIITLSLRQARCTLGEQSRNFKSRVKQMRTSRSRPRPQSMVMPCGDNPSFALINASAT